MMMNLDSFRIDLRLTITLNSKREIILRVMEGSTMARREAGTIMGEEMVVI
jgi:hypothetical protein